MTTRALPGGAGTVDRRSCGSWSRRRHWAPLPGSARHMPRKIDLPRHTTHRNNVSLPSRRGAGHGHTTRVLWSVPSTEALTIRPQAAAQAMFDDRVRNSCSTTESGVPASSREGAPALSTWGPLVTRSWCELGGRADAALTWARGVVGRDAGWTVAKMPTQHSRAPCALLLLAALEGPPSPRQLSAERCRSS